MAKGKHTQRRGGGACEGQIALHHIAIAHLVQCGFKIGV